MEHLLKVAKTFHLPGEIQRIVPYGSGNINDTFLVELKNGLNENKVILQRLNTVVFNQPVEVMANMSLVTSHIAKKLAKSFDSEEQEKNRRWDVPAIYQSQGGLDYYIDTEQSFWRAMAYIDGAKVYESPVNDDHAKETGFALGRFHQLISDLETHRLYDTLPGFHITPQYLHHFDQVYHQRSNPTNSADRDYCVKFIEKRRGAAHVLESAKKNKELAERPIHGDPKISNILFDENSNRAISFIDLDTVKPGLIHYDVGDCLRSCCNVAGEAPSNLEDVSFELGICENILSGYVSETQGLLTRTDFKYLYDSIWLIAFELGLRFFTDFLEGNVYFKVTNGQHNLYRALVQFKLTESIEKQESKIRSIYLLNQKVFS